MAEFLVERPDGSAMAIEISRHFFQSWSPDDIWHMAKANPHLFTVGEGDHELPPDARVVRLVDVGSSD